MDDAEPEALGDADEEEEEEASVALRVPQSALALHFSWPSKSLGWLMMH